MNAVFLRDIMDGKKNNFDFLRFLAAVTVIFSHSFSLSGANSHYPKNILTDQMDLGRIAVYVFLMISGFLVTLSFDRSRDSFTYWKGRILRIFPGLTVVLLLSAFVLGPLVTTLTTREYFADPRTYQYLKAISLLNMQYTLPGVFENNPYKDAVNGSLWSLGYEFTCYIVIAIIGFFKLLDKKVVLPLFLSVFLMNFLDYSTRVPLGQTVAFLTYFMAGALFYLCRDTVPISFKHFVIALVLLALSVRLHIMDVALPIFGTYIIIYIAFCPQIRLHNFAKRGDLSYGIYIYAFPVQQLLTYLFGGKMNEYINFIIAVPVVVLLAFLSWHLVEGPCLRLKKRSFNLPFINKQVIPRSGV